MSTEVRTIGKWASPDAPPSNPAPEGDHRKRRRNRTTQSCLNCHTSKRMCDRKRPCGRCTQLGLTGLCVYEVDDPGQRNGAHDESSRLRQRVAELEGVIRELKNKPHPRWAKSRSSSGEKVERCRARARSRSSSGDRTVEYPSPPQSDAVSLRLTTPDSVLSGASPEEQMPCLAANEKFPPSSPRSAGGPIALSALPHLEINSLPSAPLTGIVPSTNEHPQMPLAVADDKQLADDIDLTSWLMSYPDLMGCDKSPGHVDRSLCVNTHTAQCVDPRPTRYHHAQFLDGHCGCLHDAASYNVALELSLRLRKAADILSHSANHRSNNGCPLYRRVVDLDAFATTSLGNVTNSPDDFGPMPLRSRANTAPTSPIPPTYSARGCVPPLRAPVVSAPSCHSLRSWNGVTCAPELSAPCEGSFMTWEPPRLR